MIKPKDEKLNIGYKAYNDEYNHIDIPFKSKVKQDLSVV